ncbi:MAG: hypothetical protein U5K37_01320 [Natrialbaceae archaeon]|nr:hypothetical protein [Natrialbaceae archaeon]
MPEPTGDSDAPAILGTTGAALALVGSGLPVRSGSQEPVSLVLLGVTALAIAVVFARRREWIARRPGAILTAIAGLAIIPLVVLVHTTGSSPAVGIPLIGPVPVVGAAAMWCTGTRRWCSR